MASSEFERLAFEAALRSLDKQERVVGDLRTRTGTLLAASSLAGAFLGREALTGPTSLPLAAVALAAFVISTLLSVYVLLPKRDLAFFESAQRLYSDLLPVKDDMAEVYRRLAFQLDVGSEKNDRLLGQLSRAYGVAAVALVAEILSMATILSGTLF